MHRKGGDTAEMLTGTVQSSGDWMLRAVPGEGAWGATFYLGCVLPLRLGLTANPVLSALSFSPFLQCTSAALIKGLLKHESKSCDYFKTI